MKYLFTAFFAAVFSSTVFSQNENFEFLNPNLPVEERVDLLVSQMTLKEKNGCGNVGNQIQDAAIVVLLQNLKATQMRCQKIRRFFCNVQ